MKVKEIEDLPTLKLETFECREIFNGRTCFLCRMFHKRKAHKEAVLSAFDFQQFIEQRVRCVVFAHKRQCHFMIGRDQCEDIGVSLKAGAFFI